MICDSHQTNVTASGFEILVEFIGSKSFLLASFVCLGEVRLKKSRIPLAMLLSWLCPPKFEGEVAIVIAFRSRHDVWRDQVIVNLIESTCLLVRTLIAKRLHRLRFGHLTRCSMRHSQSRQQADQ